VDALAPLEPHVVPCFSEIAMAGVDPGQWSTTPPDKTTIAKLGRNLGDGGYMEVEVADPKVLNLRHICLVRCSAAGRVDKAGRMLTALTCSADTVARVAMLKRLKPTFHVCSVNPNKCGLVDKKAVHVRRYRVLTSAVFAARLASATAEKLHLVKPIEVGITRKRSLASDEEDTADDYDGDTSGAESVDIGGRVSPSTIAAGVAKAKPRKEKEAEKDKEKEKEVATEKGKDSKPGGASAAAADQLEAALLELTKPAAGADVVNLVGSPAVISKATFGGVALSASDLGLMKAKVRLDELRKSLGSGAVKQAVSTTTPVVVSSVEASFADILRQRVASGRAASSSASGSIPPAAVPGPPPALPSGAPLDAKSVAAELAEVLGVRRGPNIFGEEEAFSDAGSTRAAYLKSAEKNPGRITFKELEGMMEGLFDSGTPGTVSGPVVGQFLSRVWIPQHPMKDDSSNYREMRTLSTALGLLISGKAPEAADVLMSRFMSCQRRILDGDDRVAKFFELIPVDRKGSSTRDETNEYVEQLQASAAKRARVLNEGAVR
jgi:hypothetical protein